MTDPLRSGALASLVATAVAWLVARDRRLAAAVGGLPAASVAVSTWLAARHGPSLVAPFDVD